METVDILKEYTQLNWTFCFWTLNCILFTITLKYSFLKIYLYICDDEFDSLKYINFKWNID